VSSLPGWLSDAFSRIASGAGFKPRTLFTNRDQEIFRGKRPIVMDGISEVVRKSDMLSRTLLIDVPPISGSRRQYDEDLGAAFDKHHAGILGALLDALSAGLANKDSVVLEDRHKSRLIDFDRWAVATEQALGMKPGTYVNARELSRGVATTKALESEPIWVPLDTLARAHTQMRPWQGTTKKLLKKLDDLEENSALKRSKEWPKTPEKLRAILRSLAGEMLEHGVHFEIDEDGSKRHGQPYFLWADADE
jgi:putative DNA primase/helicase